MRVLVVTPPAAPFVDLASVKKHLRVDSADEDALIGGYLAAAIDHVDGPGGWLGRAIGVQTLEARLESFPGACLELPFPPLRSVVSVKYDDADGTEQTASPAIYLADPYGLMLAPAQSWPSAIGRRGAVRIRFAAGYDTPPPAIVAAVLLMVGDLYANRETSLAGDASSKVQMSTTVENLLSPYRVWSA